MTIKKILVTGSSGTIGTRLCEKLLEEDYEIIGIDLKPNRIGRQQFQRYAKHR